MGNKILVILGIFYLEVVDIDDDSVICYFNQKIKFEDYCIYCQYCGFFIILFFQCVRFSFIYFNVFLLIVMLFVCGGWGYECVQVVVFQCFELDFWLIWKWENKVGSYSDMYDRFFF